MRLGSVHIAQFGDGALNTIMYSFRLTRVSCLFYCGRNAPNRYFRAVRLDWVRFRIAVIAKMCGCIGSDTEAHVRTSVPAGQMKKSNTNGSRAVSRFSAHSKNVTEVPESQREILHKCKSLAAMSV